MNYHKIILILFFLFTLTLLIVSVMTGGASADCEPPEITNFYLNDREGGRTALGWDTENADKIIISTEGYVIFRTTFKKAGILFQKRDPAVYRVYVENECGDYIFEDKEL